MVWSSAATHRACTGLQGVRDADIEEGWRLLRAATRTRMPALPEHGDEGAASRYLIAWCEEWVPMSTVGPR